MSTKNLLQIISYLLVVTMMAIAQTAVTRPELKLNEVVERELSKGQTHEYQVTLKAGEFMQVRVEQKGVDVVLSICSRDGKQLVEMDSPNEAEGFEILSFKANDAGIRIVRVNYLDQTDDSQAGKYAIRLAEKREFTPKDVIQIDAEQQPQLTHNDRHSKLLPVWNQRNFALRSRS